MEVRRENSWTVKEKAGELKLRLSAKGSPRMRMPKPKRGEIGADILRRLDLCRL